MKKRIVYPAMAAIIVLLITASLLFVSRSERRREPAGTIKAFFHLYASPAKEELVFVLEDFEKHYPAIKIEAVIEPYQDLKRTLTTFLSSEPDDRRAGDKAVLTVLTGTDLGLTENTADVPPTPWISDSWRLFYSKSRLEASGMSPGELEELASGDFDNFVSALAEKTAEDEYLFYTGANYYWPWLSWIQHLQLEADGGRQPSGFSEQEYALGLERWNRLLAGGHINPDFAETGLAASLYTISNGKGLFVMSSSSIYGAYLPDERADIGSIPFPGSAAQGWQVGSSFYLVPIFPEGAGPAVRAAAELLVSHLRSDTVRDRFLSATGIRLLPGASPGAVREIPSITPKVRDPELRGLIQLIR